MYEIKHYNIYREYFWSLFRWLGIIIFSCDRNTRKNHCWINPLVAKNRYSGQAIYFILYNMTHITNLRYRLTVYLSFTIDCLNTLRPRQYGRRFPDDVFKYIFLNENDWISLNISLKFIPKVRINNIPSLVKIMAWCRPGAQPLSEPMLGNSLTHICVTRPQWINVDCITSSPPRA